MCVLSFECEGSFVEHLRKEYGIYFKRSMTDRTIDYPPMQCFTKRLSPICTLNIKTVIIIPPVLFPLPFDR